MRIFVAFAEALTCFLLPIPVGKQVMAAVQERLHQLEQRLTRFRRGDTAGHDF